MPLLHTMPPREPIPSNMLHREQRLRMLNLAVQITSNISAVKHESISPHSPQSNGRAERLNLMLNNYAHAMLYQANMPKSFWAKAITTAAYLLNRLPSDPVDGIPYELWHARSLTMQDLKSIKPFGCIVHANVPKKGCKRLGKKETRSTTGRFIRYTDSVN